MVQLLIIFEVLDESFNYFGCFDILIWCCDCSKVLF